MSTRSLMYHSLLRSAKLLKLHSLCSATKSRGPFATVSPALYFDVRATHVIILSNFSIVTRYLHHIFVESVKFFHGNGCSRRLFLEAVLGGCSRRLFFQICLECILIALHELETGRQTSHCIANVNRRMVTTLLS